MLCQYKTSYTASNLKAFGSSGIITDTELPSVRVMTQDSRHYHTKNQFVINIDLVKPYDF